MLLIVSRGHSDDEVLLAGTLAFMATSETGERAFEYYVASIPRLGLREPISHRIGDKGTQNGT